MVIIYHLLAAIDTIIYGLASSMFRIIYDIATTEFFKAEQIEAIANRIYIVVGVLMLFKLVISAIQYMINPDVFDDKDKGMAGLLKKIVISIALIVVVPAIFNFMVWMQGPIIKTLPSIILGSNASEKTDDESIGFDLSFQILQAFVKARAGKGGSVGDSGEIHDLWSFNEHVTDDCPAFSLFGIISTDSCQYDYMIIVSTLSGGFLCYVLLSMILDIAIRTIKFGIIRILAPIPISSYIFSKDKLGKFVKSAITVYTDLFIRMAIVYFVIFAIQEMVIKNNLLNVLSINEGGVSDTGDWFRGVIVNIAIIFGLLMFAKNAPKFISELLGLPDVGSGDMADMFKPAWQRAGGAAGALINPVRGAVSNYRKAWDNNGDMGSRLRRIMNASRHAAGGAARGTLDSVQGIMAGDDWAKMQQRHQNATNQSMKHSASAFMRRTSSADVRDQNDDIQRRRSQISDFFRSQGIRVGNEREAMLPTARTNYQTHLNTLNSQASTLQNELANGTLTADQRNAKLQELNALQSEIDKLSSNDGMRKWIKSEQDRLVAEQLASQQISMLSARLGDVNTRLATARGNLAAATTDEERMRYQQEAISLANEQSQLMQSLSTEGQQQIISDMNEFVRTGTLAQKKADISTETILRGKVDQFFGGEGFTGKGYIDVADLLKNNRSGLYTGEAMTKMRQNADILVDINGNELTFTSKFNNDSAKRFSYVDMAEIKKQVDTGRIDASQLKTKYGFENAAMFQSAFEDIEKKAAEAYVSANMAQIDPGVAKNTNARLKRPREVNSTITLGIQRLKASLASSNIPNDEKERLLKELTENPGQFFKAASDMQEKLRTKGSRISAYNSGKKDS